MFGPLYVEGMDDRYETDGYFVYDEVTEDCIGFLDGDEIVLDNGDIDFVIDKW